MTSGDELKNLKKFIKKESLDTMEKYVDYFYDKGCEPINPEEKYHTKALPIFLWELFHPGETCFEYYEKQNQEEGEI